MLMNSMADRKLKIQLDSIDWHKKSIGKEIEREKKRVQKELTEAENGIRNRSGLPDVELPVEGGKKLSPRLPRRYSTPQTLLSATLTPRSLSDTRWPAGCRKRISSEGTSRETGVASPPRALSPTSQFLMPPLYQPRRQSLPPIGAGGSLVAIDPLREGFSASSPATRRGSCSGNKSPRSCSSPSSPNHRGTPRRESTANEAELEEVACKVSRFLQRMDLGKQNETPNVDAKEEGDDLADDEENELLHPLTDQPVKRSAIFQPLNFE